MDPINVVHQLNFSRSDWGGVQVQLVNFLESTAKNVAIRNFLGVDCREVHAVFTTLGAVLAAEPKNFRYWYNIAVPSVVRRLLEAQCVRRWKPDVVVNANLFGSVRAVDVARACGAAPVYWERGAAWFPRAKPFPEAFRTGHALLIANSQASAAMLREVWRMDGAEICAPCVWSRHSGESEPRSLPTSRRLRIGFAARLRAFKGGVLAVHALRDLVSRGIDAELMVAGEGPDREAVEHATASSEMTERVMMLGQADNMSAFYRSIDVLLHPALREPYGNVCAEAAVAGVPVVATHVDGLPEVVRHGTTGLCVMPELPLSDFDGFGGNRGDVYPIVYRPERGCVGEPAVPSPKALADAVMRIIDDPQTYRRFSIAAIRHSEHEFAPKRHIDRFIELMRSAKTIVS
jgi:glycosyltransferase involved in cell wall biosynthesis